MAILQIGRLGQMLVGEEATYGTSPTLLATMACRHRDLGLSHNPKNRVNLDEKRGTPGVAARGDRRETAGLDLRSAYLRPSGTIGTIPECHKFFQHGLGTAVVGTLNTTVSAGTSATLMTLASVAGLAVGEFVSVRRAANSNIPEVRQVTAIAGSDVTVAPALGGTPAAADTVRAGVTYKLATSIANSLSVAHYLPNLTRILKGAVVDRLALQFNNNEEVMFSAAGPAQTLVRPAPASPGFTTVGAQNPPTGLAGGLLVNSTAYAFISGEIVIANALALVNEDFGTSRATGYSRDGVFRDITFTLDARVTDDFTLYQLSETVANFGLFIQAGVTEGNIVAVRAPNAELAQVPDTPDDNGRLTWSFSGVCKELSATGNDEIAIGLC